MSFTMAFRRLSEALSKWFTGSYLIAVIAILLLSIVASLLTVYLIPDKTVAVSNSQSLFTQRNFSQTPFDLTDAYDACLLEAQQSLGTDMLRAQMQPLSTRYEEAEGYYLVVMSVDIGTVKEWEVASIYCTVDPKAHEVSYYKEVYDSRPSLVARGKSFLSNLFE